MQLVIKKVEYRIIGQRDSFPSPYSGLTYSYEGHDTNHNELISSYLRVTINL